MTMQNIRQGDWVYAPRRDNKPGQVLCLVGSVEWTTHSVNLHYPGSHPLFVDTVSIRDVTHEDTQFNSMYLEDQHLNDSQVLNTVRDALRPTGITS
jgi:hypothetical protein